MYDKIIITLILICSIYECIILKKEFDYDAAKDLAKKKTKTTKTTTTKPSGESVVEESVEVSEPAREEQK